MDRQSNDSSCSVPVIRWDFLGVALQGQLSGFTETWKFKSYESLPS